ncbi:MAG TPA: branched-chain amino acid ABC transporter permease [Thermodesulfobacteriota bacterium]|nr:branched-chain amino acid ABC transporter permease [Thermodesulfobacteriota bacterium]
MEKKLLNPVQQFHIEERESRFRSPAFFLRILLLAFFVFTPFLFRSFEVLDVILKITIFSALVASYDVILGYTGIVSLGHVLYFGLGCYFVGIFMGKLGWASYSHLALALLIAVVISGILSVLIGLFSLRIRAIFFAMVTLAFMEFVFILSSQLRSITGGDDGISFKLPGILAIDFSYGKLLGVEFTGRLMSYYLILVISLILFLLMLRFVHSPVGRVLQSIRDNEQRSIALGYRTYLFQVIASSFASCVAAVTGGCFAIWVRYVSPDSSLSVSIMLDVLLMVIVGGMGTLYGGIFGAAFLMITRAFLPKLQVLIASLLPGVPLAVRLSERWLFYFGLLFILIVYFFPKGIVGTAQEIFSREKGKSMSTGSG